MDPGGLDVLENACDPYFGAVADGVDVAFDRVAQIAVDQDRLVVGDTDRGGDVVAEFRVAVHDPHGLAAQYVGWPDHDRISDLAGPPSALPAPSPRYGWAVASGRADRPAP